MPVDNVVVRLASSPDYASLSDADASAKAKALTIEQTDSTRYNATTLRVKFSLATMDAIIARLNERGKHAILLMLGGIGIDFSSPEAIADLDALQADGTFPPEQITMFKRIGKPLISEYQHKGGSGDPTPQAFAEARAYIAVQDAKNRLIDRFNLALAKLESGEFTTFEQAKAFMGS